MIPLLSNDKEIISILRKSLHPSTKDMICFYSSQLNAFITDPVFMSISIQDKIIHRGYSVFDTTKIFGNKIYQLDKHLDRFIDSITKIYLTPKYSKSELKSILIQMAVVTRKFEPSSDIDLRYFYSGGVGSFDLRVNNNINNTFYVVATRANNKLRPFDGVKEITVNIPALKNELIPVKSTNYIVNSIVQRKAQMGDAFMGIFTDENGYLLESPTNNIAFVLKDKSFCVPPFEKTLVGTTIVRCFEFIKNDLISKGEITEIRRNYLTLDDVKNNAIEVMLVGGDFVIPVLKIDNLEISSIPGDITRKLQNFLSNDKTIDIASEDVSFENELMI